MWISRTMKVVVVEGGRSCIEFLLCVVAGLDCGFCTNWGLLGSSVGPWEEFFFGHQCDCGVHCAKSDSVVAQVACTNWGLVGSSEGP